MEEGRITWDETHKIDRVRRAYAHRSTSSSQASYVNKKLGNKDQSMPCRYFQKNSCSHKGDHETGGRLYLHICSYFHSQGKNITHSLKDLSKDKKRVGHCSNAVPSTEKNCQGRMYSERVINNTSKDSLSSINWKLETGQNLRTNLMPQLSNKIFPKNRVMKINL